MLNLNFGFSSIIILLVDSSFLNESLEDLLAGGKSDGVFPLTALAGNFLIYFISIFELLVLLLHEILQIITNNSIGPFILFLYSPFQRVLMCVVLSQSMVEIAIGMLAILPLDEMRAIS